MCRSWFYKAVNPPQKSRPPESGHKRHGVWIAIEYSYKLGQKKEFKFLCELGWFSQIQSHMFSCILIIVTIDTIQKYK